MVDFHWKPNASWAERPQALKLKACKDLLLGLVDEECRGRKPLKINMEPQKLGGLYMCFLFLSGFHVSFSGV